MNKTIRTLLRAFLLASALIFPTLATAANKCATADDAVLKACKSVTFKTLPADLRKHMAKTKCDVKSGSSYDEGYALDLNGDGKTDYAFCCYSAQHGPCGMVVFSKPADKWLTISDDLRFPNDSTACNGFVPLKTKSANYSDICIDEGSMLLKFKDGKYVDSK